MSSSTSTARSRSRWRGGRGASAGFIFIFFLFSCKTRPMCAPKYSSLTFLSVHFFCGFLRWSRCHPHPDIGLFLVRWPPLPERNTVRYYAAAHWIWPIPQLSLGQKLNSTLSNNIFV
jgi:hypothetical protein